MARSSKPKLEVILGAIDRISAPLRAINRKIESVQRPIRSVQNAMRGLAKEAGIFTLGRKFQRLGRGISGLRTGFTQIIGRLALIGGAVGFAAWSTLERLAGTAGEIVDLSKQLGITTDELQGLHFAAKMTGGSAKAFDAGFQRFSKSLADATKGSGAAYDAFAELGIPLLDNQGKLRRNVDVFRDFADRMSKVTDQSQRLRLAQALMGKGGGALVNMLSEGSAGIDTWVDRAQRLGIITSGSTLKGLDALSDKFDFLRAIVSSNALTIAGELLPGINRIIDATLGWWEANRATVLPQVVEHLKQLVTWTGMFLGWVVKVTPGVLGFIDSIGGLKTVLGVLAAVALFPVITGFAMMVASIGTITAAIGMWPLIIGGVAAAVVALWHPVTTAFGAWWDQLKLIVNFLSEDLTAAVRRVSSVLSPIANAFEALGSALGIRPAETAFATPAPASPIGMRSGGSLARPAAGGGGAAARVDGAIKVEVSDQRVRASVVQHAGDVSMEVDSGVAHVSQS